MKKTISILVALLIMCTHLLVSAETEYTPEGLKATQKLYSDLITEAIEKSEYDEEKLDKEHIFIVKNTNPIAMRQNSDEIWLWVALPVLDSSDISFAHFDDGEYIQAITNFVSFEGMKLPYGENLKQYIDENQLSEPSEITNLWISERVHLFAYNVVCDDVEYIIPHHFADYSLFNITEDESCIIEIGKAYTTEEFLTICEKEAELFAESKKEEREQERADTSYTYVDNNGEEVMTKSVENEETDDTEKQKEKQEEKISDGDSARIYTFEELTGLSREDIHHIVIRSGMDGVGYSTAYDEIISDIYNVINTKSFNVYMSEGNSGGWRYQILFFDKDNAASAYTISTGITVKEKDGLTYRTSNEEELKKIVADAYNLIANDCSNWSADYIAEAKDLGILEDVSDISYKEPITREKFCEIIYNMLDKSMDIKWEKTSPNPFKDTFNEKVFSLCHEGIIEGKGGYAFAPDDFLTREEAATILIRTAQYMGIDMPQSAYDGKVYDDEHLISDWAFNSVFYAREIGLMIGTSETEFSPQKKYTAEQAIATIIRLFDKYEN